MSGSSGEGGPAAEVGEGSAERLSSSSSSLPASDRITSSVATSSPSRASRRAGAGAGALVRFLDFLDFFGELPPPVLALAFFVAFFGDALGDEFMSRGSPKGQAAPTDLPIP